MYVCVCVNGLESIRRDTKNCDGLRYVLGTLGSDFETTTNPNLFDGTLYIVTFFGIFVSDFSTDSTKTIRLIQVHLKLDHKLI